MTKCFGRLALHTWTVDTTPLGAAIHAAKSAGYDAIELRNIDFRRCLDLGMNNDQILDLIHRSDMPVGILGVEYGWLFAAGEENKRLWSAFRKSCADAVALNCPMLMSAPGPLSGSISDAIANLRVGADIASEHGLDLAIEFNCQHDVINRLVTLREMIGAAGRSNCGMVLDAYHMHRTGAFGGVFEEVTGEEIFVFQYSDCPANPDLTSKRPIDRLPPGQGVLPWHEIFQMLLEKNFTGYLSYEAPNPLTWERPALDVAAEGAILARTFIGEVKNGSARMAGIRGAK